MLAGLALLVYSLGAYVGVVPGGYTRAPRPVALGEGDERAVRLEAAPAQPSARPGSLSPTATAVPVAEVELPSERAAAVPTAPTEATREPRREQPPVVVKGDPSDADERRQAALTPRPGAPIRLELPSIAVEAEVKPAGVRDGPDGQPEWETLPFVAANYPTLGPVGAPGNPVISGHVVTLYEGNVFRDLYRVQLGDTVRVYTSDSRFSYRVEEIRLVEPGDVSVMASSEDARLTIITCGGTFDPRTRTFSERLIVIGKLVGGERLARQS